MPIKGFILIMLLVVAVAFCYRRNIYEWLNDEKEDDSKEDKELYMVLTA